MIPLHLDPLRMRCALIGRGQSAARRLIWLRDAGASPEVWADDPEAALMEAAAGNLERRLPHAAELAAYHVLWIVDLPLKAAAELAKMARAARVLVNVEDVPDLCDFHMPAVVRRGGLTLSAGTGGASPAVARAAREQLEITFPETWAKALEEIARSRAALRARGARVNTLTADARDRLAQLGLI